MSLLQEMQQHGLADCEFNRQLIGAHTMIKTKTATIKIYRAYGTSHMVLDICYRGKLLYRFEGDDPFELISKAHRWIYNSDEGFTGTKTETQI
jgi:hypothetical protein